MKEEHTGGLKATEDTLSDAVQLVNDKIADTCTKLEKISKNTGVPLVSVDGVTSTGCCATAQIAPDKVAKVMLRFNYHFWHVLNDDEPEEMWDEIAELVGFESASSVDIGL